MKRILAFVSVLVLSLAAAGAAMAQNESMIGTWKLNVARSKYVSLKAPQNETRTVVAQGSGVKISFEGVAADGSKIDYTIAGTFDGKDSPVSGVGQANGADSISMVRVDANTTRATLKRAGKVVQTSTTVTSKDGKVATITMKGTNPKGEATASTTVWEKQ